MISFHYHELHQELGFFCYVLFSLVFSLSFSSYQNTFEAVWRCAVIYFPGKDFTQKIQCTSASGAPIQVSWKRDTQQLAWVWPPISLQPGRAWNQNLQADSMGTYVNWVFEHCIPHLLNIGMRPCIYFYPPPVVFLLVLGTFSHRQTLNWGYVSLFFFS